jgi:chitin disaccharide deacetylase
LRDIAATEDQTETFMVATTPSNEPRQFALCADDFALSPAVSRGILAALAAGRLTATSAMTTRPHWPEAALGLRDGGFATDVGLHLNLTLGAPLTAMPRFAPSSFPPIGRVMRTAGTADFPMSEIVAEIEAQIDAFAQAFGRQPDFVDGHQHVHVLPGIRQSLLDVLDRKNLAGRLWLRNSGDRLSRIFARRQAIKKALVLAWLSRDFEREATTRGFVVNDGFAGFSSFRGDGNFGHDFARYLVAPGTRHLIMCHPGHVDAELAALDPVTASREKELAFLLSSGFAEAIEQAAARLVRPSSWLKM